MGNELKYAKEFLLNHYRKSLKNYEVAGPTLWWWS